MKKKHEDNKKFLKANKIITIHRKQISTNYPAVAQLRIEFPEKNNNINIFFDQFCSKYPIDADYYMLRRLDDYVYELEVRSTKMMYAWLERFCVKFVAKYSNVKLSGYWDKYEC